MADAWEIIVAHATDTSDAWTALNSQETGGTTITIANEAATWDIVEKYERFVIEVKDVVFQVTAEEIPFGV